MEVLIAASYVTWPPNVPFCRWITRWNDGKVLFPQQYFRPMLLKSDPINEDAGYLVLRVAAGGMMLWQHGLPKLLGFGDKMDTFSDPLGVGSVLSLTLIVFAEFFCSALVVLGLWTRLATVPLIIGMAVAAFMVHGDDPFKKQELPLLFMAAFITIFLVGSGRFAVDRISFR